MARSSSKKSSSKKRYGIELLPEELIFKIFVFLPVITLLRCKSVCKSWLSIILNPKFIETHLIESQKRQPLLILRSLTQQLYFDTDSETSSLLIQLPEYFTCMTAFVASCNGLVCLASNVLDIIYLWNPMIRQFKKLPTPNNTRRFSWFMLGFGYDSFSNDYKILRIALKIAYVGYNGGDFVYSLYVEMYSANEDSWKEIEVPKTLEFFKFYPSADVGVFLPQTPGILYFRGFYELLSFDLHYEVFRVYPYHIPGKSPMFEQTELRMANILNFEGSLAMIYKESVDDGKSFYSLWTFDVDRGNVSWTKQFNIENSSENEYLGDEQFVIVKRNYSGRGSNYRYYTKILATKFIDPPPRRYIYEVAKYSESLVSLKGFEQLK